MAVTKLSGTSLPTSSALEDWADSILSTLEVNLDKFLGAVKRGRERLHERSQETVVAGVGRELKRGAGVDLYLIRLGAAKTNDGWEPLLLVESFRKPN